MEAAIDPPTAGSAAVLLAGDAGVGKTALIGTVSARVSPQRRVLVGHCVGETAGTLSYLPFVEALARLDATDPAAIDDVVAVYPAFARLVPRRATEDEAGDWSRIVEAVHGGLELLASSRPLLLVVEDIHWADESTRELLTLLFTRGFSTPVSILVSYRSDDLHRRHPLRSSLGVWSRLRVTRIDVPPLEDAAMRALVRAADVALSEETVTDVVDRARGNAFFAQELVSVAGTGDRDDLGRLLLRRLDPLGDDAQDVVRLASVVGRRVSHEMLLAVTDLDAARLDRLLREVVDHHILEPTRDGGYTFRHALLAEAVYDDLLPGERVRHHRTCARALQDRPDLGPAADLARHALAVHDVDLAITSSVAAGDAADRIGGPAEAVHHFENALSLLPDTDERVHRLTVRAAAAALASGRVTAAAGLLRSRLRRDDLPPLERAELLARLAGALNFSDEPADRVAIVDDALSLVPETGEDDLRADLLTRRVEALWIDGRIEEVLVQAEDLSRSGMLDDRRHLRTEVSSIVAKARSQEPDGGESLAAIDRVLAGWGDGVDSALLRALHTRAQILFRHGDLRRARDAHVSTVELARSAGLQRSPYAAYAHALAVLCSYEIGEWDRAAELAADQGEHSTEMLASLQAALSLVHAGRGEPEAVSIFERLRELWEMERSNVVQSGTAALDLHGWSGDLAAARKVRDDVVSFLRAASHQAHVMAEVRLDALLLAHLAMRAGRAGTTERAALLDEGRHLAEEAASVWRQQADLPPRTIEAWAWEARARAEYLFLRWQAGEQVDVDELLAEFTSCRELFARKEDRYEEARCRSRSAMVLDAVGRADEAGRERKAAAATARALRAAPLLAELGSTGAPAGNDPSPRAAAAIPQTPTPALTPRECEVLELVSRGRTNGEIGRQLFISTKTASVHVSNILTKLGAANRAEAAAIARDLGLLG